MMLKSIAAKMRPRLAAGLLAVALATVGVGLTASPASAYGVVSAGAVPGSSYIINPDTMGCPSNYGYDMLGTAPLHCSFEDVYSLYPGRWSPWVIKHTIAYVGNGTTWVPVSHPYEWQKTNCNEQCTIGANVSIYWRDYYSAGYLMGGEDAVDVPPGQYKYVKLVTDLYFYNGTAWVTTTRHAAEHVFYANGNNYYMTTGGICYH
jgi:hypothetical protein